MNAIRIRKQLDSETLPELKPFVGRTVEIIVLDEAQVEIGPQAALHKRGSFWEHKTVEELAAEQGVKPVKDVEDLRGGWPEEERNDGFEHWLNARRKAEMIPSLPEE